LHQEKKVYAINKTALKARVPFDLEARVLSTYGKELSQRTTNTEFVGFIRRRVKGRRRDGQRLRLLQKDAL
jgi:hypothetical protein